MKKHIVIVCLLSFFAEFIFAAGSAASANRKTANKCLKNAEKCVIEEKWERALQQAELGLSYDDSISDLIYIKAAALSSLGKTRQVILPVISLAFEKNNWTDYNKNGARILIADLLSDTGDYQKSLEYLDMEPCVYTEDAEFIRIKDYYRMGTVEALEKARNKVDSSRRAFPQDERFPSIFFLFESMYKNEAELNGMEYSVPPLVQQIANAYIDKFPDYSGNNEEMEVYALFLAEPSVQERLVKSISAKTKSENPMLVIAQMKMKMISDEQAYDMFFDYIDNSVNLSVLELFLSYLSDNQIKYKVVEKFTNFDGTILIDDNLDLQCEVSVKYSLGRPQYIYNDFNNDGKNDFYCVCDFGSPVSVNFVNEGVDIFYEMYPAVQKISYLEDNYNFDFTHNDYSFTPFEMLANNQFNNIGLVFYIPVIKNDLSVPTPYDLVLKSTFVELPINERNNAKIVYTTLKGTLVSAKFYEGDFNYAYCDFTTGAPFVRYSDYDNDEHYETTEIFDVVPEGYVLSDEENESIEKIFSKVVSGRNYYLKKIQIDRNSNTYNEFAEEFLLGGGSIITWDNDDNGICDSQFITYPKDKSGSVIEESIFYDSNGLELVVLYSVNGLPLKMNYNGEEVRIIAGESSNFYWVGESFPKDVEEKIVDFTDKGIVQGVVDLVEYKENRFSIIRVGNEIFAKKIPYDVK